MGFEAEGLLPLGLKPVAVYESPLGVVSGLFLVGKEEECLQDEEVLGPDEACLKGGGDESDDRRGREGQNRQGSEAC